MLLIQKWPFFPVFFFREYRPGKWLLRYSRTKKRLSRHWKQEVQKVEKRSFFPKGLTHVFGPRMAIFPSFFLGIIGQENIFYDIAERKNAFLGYKNKKFRKSKMAIFQKGLTHGFGPKMAIFPSVFFRQYSPGKCLLWYSRT